MKRFFFLLFIYLINPEIDAQRTIHADLDEIIESAVSKSPAKLLAKTRLSNRYWQFVSYNSNFKPQLSFSSTLPGITRRIDAIPLPDGSEAFVNRAFMNTSADFRLSQLVPQTGGRIFVRTGLDRLDLFGTSSQKSSKSYLSTPISIGFFQPLFQFNSFKWERKINELEYNQSKQVYTEENEEIIYNAVNLYFDLYISRINLDQAYRDKDYLDSLTVTSEGRYGVGRISETDLLQVQLTAKNANAQVNAFELEVQNKNESLRNYMGIEEDVLFILDTPQNIPSYEIDFITALEQAEKNRNLTTDFRLRLMRAEMNLEETQKSSGINLSLDGSFGLTKSASRFSDVYLDLLDQESINLNINVPIADWGRAKAQKEIAKSNLELVRLQVEQDIISFQREIAVNVEQFNLKRKQLVLAIESLEIAEKRLEISKNRYEVGKIDLTNLNIAIQEHESARQAYYTALWTLRRAHHEIRLLTLYDFVNKEPILVGTE